MNNIKLCIFDVDGVLVNSRELHYPATAAALADYGCMYNREEDEMFGTIPTRQKLHRLAEYNRISSDDLDDIWQLKDEYARAYFDDTILINENIKELFEELKSRDMWIALGSNARYSFLEKVIVALDVEGLVDHIASAQGMKPKPDPYMYISAMEKFEVAPEMTLIFEDSGVGKQAAYSSGAWVYEVKSYNELSINILNETDCSSGQFKRARSIHRELTRTNIILH